MDEVTDTFRFVLGVAEEVYKEGYREAVLEESEDGYAKVLSYVFPG